MWNEYFFSNLICCLFSYTYLNLVLFKHSVQHLGVYATLCSHIALRKFIKLFLPLSLQRVNKFPRVMRRPLLKWLTRNFNVIFNYFIYAGTKGTIGRNSELTFI